jgi:hypothetical protein
MFDQKKIEAKAQLNPQEFEEVQALPAENALQNTSQEVAEWYEPS